MGFHLWNFELSMSRHFCYRQKSMFNVFRNNPLLVLEYHSVYFHEKCNVKCICFNMRYLLSY